MCLIFLTPFGFWEYEYYVWELIELDEDINQMKEYACKFLGLIGLGIDFENMPCWLYSVIPMQAFEPSTLYSLSVHFFNDMYL